MNSKLTIILIILAIIPIGLLGWMGYSAIKSEETRREQKIRYMGSRELELAEKSIEQLFSNLEIELEELVANSETDIASIRILQRKHNLIKQIFISGREKLLYPSEEIPLSNREKEFLRRVKETDISFNFLNKSVTENQKDTVLRGWHTWFMGDGLNFIFWRTRDTADGEIVIEGLELNREALLSGIINSLPATDETSQSKRISLIDVKGNTIYQWGGWSPPADKRADSSLSLAYPLSSWHLEVFIDPETVTIGNDRLIIGFSLLTIVFVIMALTFYLLRERTREIREASQKVSFVNQVSHELKTPLTNIRLYAEVLESQLTGENKKNRKHLNIIISESMRLGRLINNVLSFAKDQKNSISLNPAPVIPDEIIQKLLDSFNYSLKSRDIKLHTNLKASTVSMMDPEILEQILSNLVSNVEKYAARGKWIKVASAYQDETFILTVSDKGPGIPENLKEKIFEPFYRVSNKLTDGVSGTGIGLTLVKTLAELHGGKAILLQTGKEDYNSEFADLGAVFQISLKISMEVK